jgi:hypothetical protein
MFFIFFYDILDIDSEVLRIFQMNMQFIFIL